jgi:hypothetical protein
MESQENSVLLEVTVLLVLLLSSHAQRELLTALVEERVQVIVLLAGQGITVLEIQTQHQQPNAQQVIIALLDLLLLLNTLLILAIMLLLEVFIKSLAFKVLLTQVLIKNHALPALQVNTVIPLA